MRERWIPAEFFTSQHRLRGFIDPGKDRLSDFINDALQSSIQLRDVEVARVIQPDETPVRYAELVVMKDRLCFLLLLEERAGLSSDWIFHPVAKTPYPFVLALEFYEIAGQIYLQGRGDPVEQLGGDLLGKPR